MNQCLHVGRQWTNNISWVRGYDDILIQTERAGSQFHEHVLACEVSSPGSGYPNALLHLLAGDSGCHRYWGEGMWAYGAEPARRAAEIVPRDL